LPWSASENTESGETQVDELHFGEPFVFGVDQVVHSLGPGKIAQKQLGRLHNAGLRKARAGQPIQRTRTERWYGLGNCGRSFLSPARGSPSRLWPERRRLPLRSKYRRPRAPGCSSCFLGLRAPAAVSARPGVKFCYAEQVEHVLVVDLKHRHQELGTRGDSGQDRAYEPNHKSMLFVQLEVFTQGCLAEERTEHRVRFSFVNLLLPEPV
jgi:hypothetical protein